MNNYMVLYRKYRPNSFSSLVGQAYTKQILMNSIINNKISHSYIFSGPRGTGKTSTARIFAKAINCLNNSNGEACGECYNCQNFTNNTDIIEIDAASNNGVDQIREITNNVKLAPTMSKYKVYIIDEVHMLTESAFNALLLTLEEPPSHVIFIFATTNIENVPITILSRCQRFEFRKISNEDIINRLKYICNEEKIDINQDALEEIAYISDGGLRDSLSLLDQLSKNDVPITLDMVLDEIGSVSNNSVMKLLGYLESNDSESIIKTIDNYRNLNLDYKIIVKKIIDESTNTAKNIILTNKVNRLTYDDYKNIVFEFADSFNKLNINVDSYAFIELILLKYIKVLKPSSNYEVSKINNFNKNNVINNNFVNSKINSLDSNIDIRINNCFCGATKQLKSDAINLWKQFIYSDLIDDNIKGIVMDSSVLLASDKIYVINTMNSLIKEFNDNSEMISDNFNKIFKKNIKFVSIDNNKWDEVSKKYIDDMKNGIKYEYIEETIPVNEQELEKIATNVFSCDKIEID